MFEPPAVTVARNLLTAASSTFFSDDSRFLVLLGGLLAGLLAANEALGREIASAALHPPPEVLLV